jgi:hypothetical protein
VPFMNSITRFCAIEFSTSWRISSSVMIIALPPS